MTLSGTFSDENTTKLTDRAGAETSVEDVSPFKKSLLIEQKIFQGGARAELKKSEIGYDLAKQKLKKVEQDIIYETIEIYTELVLNNQKYEINLSNVNLLERQTETDKFRLERGEISITDLAQSEASLAGAKAQLIKAQNDLVTSKFNYEKTIGRINNFTDVVENYKFNYKIPNTLSEASLISKIFNADLNIAKLELNQAEKDIAIAKSDLKPSGSLSFEAIQTDDTSSTYNERDKEILKATITWPFYSGGKNKANFNKYKFLKNKKRLLLEDEIKSNETKLSSAWSNYKSSKSFLQSTKLQVNAAEIANEGITLEYESGLGRSTLDVIQSNSILLDAKTSLANSKRDYFLSQYFLLKLMGKLTFADLSLN
jgi:outer membrane protein